MSDINGDFPNHVSWSSPSSFTSEVTQTGGDRCLTPPQTDPAKQRMIVKKKRGPMPKTPFSNSEIDA